MRSRSDSVDEEGEIIETEVEKAPPSLPSVTGPSIDRHSSRQKGSLSPALGYIENHDLHSSLPYYDNRNHYDGGNHRYRSHDCQRSEKRRYSEEGGDPRRHRVHYEVTGDGGSHIHRSRVSYADIDKTEPREMLSKSYDRSGYNEVKRIRVSFPAVLSGGHDRYDEERRSKSRSRTPLSTGNREYHAWNSAQHYIRDENDRNRPSEKSYSGTRIGHNDGKEASREQLSLERKRFDRSFNNQQPTSEGHDNTTRDLLQTVDMEDLVGETVRAEDLVDESKLIEQRRKQREAIRAKYRRHVTPVVLSSSVNEVSTMNSLNVPCSQESLVSSIQLSPHDDGTPVGIFTIAKDKTTQNHRKQSIGGPSAADYDPTLDMQEDNKRNEQRIHVREADELAVKAQLEEIEIVLDEPNARSLSASEAVDALDMFADAEENEAPIQPLAIKSAGQKYVKQLPVIPAAQQLDVSLLDNWDDADGYYKVIPGELLDNRYRVQNSLGKGMFSGVVRANDMMTSKEKAIKIIRKNETMRKAGIKEIDILRKLCQADPDDKKHLVRFERHFDHKNHLCLVFENLNLNLREVLKKSGIRDVGISLKAVRAYAHQMFLGLSLLRKCNILHADLKPDNVLVNESQNVLKICDLGSASDVAENDITPYLVSRFYRAPEIILGVPYEFAVDMWSIGCTLYELYTGKILFTGRTNNQMLRSIMECRGRLSHKFLKRGKFTHLHFDELLNFRSLETDKITGRDIVRVMSFNKPTQELKTRLLSAACGSESETKDLNLFIDLLERCLNLNPEKRCTPSEALKHPFIHRAK